MVPVFDLLRTAYARRSVSVLGASCKDRVAASRGQPQNHHATYVQGDLLIERIADVEPFGQMMRI
jgi:hypothetical protein